MKLLAIDTSTDLATVALTVNGELYTEEQTGTRQHAQFLLPMIDRLLSMAGLSCHELEGIVFGRGPGSFTGLRIACSVAKGLAYAHDLPMYPVSGLAAIAYEIGLGVPVLTMIDARMHQVYWAYFEKDLVNVPEQVSAPEDIELIIAKPLILAGVGFEPYAHQLPSALQAHIIQQQVVFPRAQSMVGLVESGKIKPISAKAALPVYVRNQVTQGGGSRG